ncbi:YdiY family protein [Pendulispora albinea]|uniref:DUF481 domain-containing protein n=1 Tax=Pendulispora albinea TaxID=2741071 RepID=A0ABZ2LQ48_9BACT
MSATIYLRGSIVAVLSLLAATARAQTAPPPNTAGGSAAQATASKGSTDIVKDQFAAAGARDQKDGMAGNVQAGGILTSGNSRALAATIAGQYRYRQDIHQISAAAAGNYGEAAKTGEAVAQTVGNVQGLVRYDLFFAEHWSAFLQVGARRDRFQGLDLRLNIDPGVSYYFLEDQKHRFWVEAGYDFQYDIRRTEQLADAKLADPTGDYPRTKGRHSGRLFVGYDNQLNAFVNFTTGVEYLQPFDPTRAWRLTWNNQLKSAISDQFSLATTFTLRYDHDPLPGVKDTDTITSVAIIYTFK